jgi:putative ABC transport system permease protein
MTSLGLAWRSLTRQPARAMLGVVGIAAVGALLFDMLLLSRGLVVSFQDLLDSIGFDVRVTATRALPTVGPRLDDGVTIADSIRELPEVREAVPLCIGEAGIVQPDGSLLDVSFVGSGPSDSTWTVVEGTSLPRVDEGGPAPLLINLNLAKRLGLSPGDGVKLKSGSPGFVSLPPMAFRVVGIAEFAFDASDELSAATDLPSYFRSFGGDDSGSVDLVLVSSRPESGTDSAIASIQRRYPGLHTFSNEQLVARFRNTDFSYFRQISFVLSSVTLFFAFLLVTTLLTVSVNQRFAEVAGLRAIGFSRRRIVADLLCESALMVGTGGILALPAGALLATQLDAILRAMPGLPERLHFFVFEPRAVFLYVLLLTVTGLLASVYPVFLAVRLPIAATLRKEVVS